MKVTLLNPEILDTLYRNHGQFACICYDTPMEHAEQVGGKCQVSGHMSGSRCEYIKFLITDVDRGTAEQCLRHEIGTAIPYEMQDNYYIADYSEMVINVPPDQIVKNMASFRYIDKRGFNWETPARVKHCEEANSAYQKGMQALRQSRNDVRAALIKAGYTPQEATEDANMMLARATTTSLVIGMTPEALIHFCHKRLCLRVQEFIRRIARQMKEEVQEHNARFAKELMPHCEHLLWCPEGDRCCGMAPTKAQLKAFLEAYKTELKQFVGGGADGTIS